MCAITNLMNGGEGRCLYQLIKMGWKGRNVVCKYESTKHVCIKCVCITVHWEMRNWGLKSGIYWPLRLSSLMYLSKLQNAFVNIIKCIYVKVHSEMRNWGLQSGISRPLRLSWLRASQQEQRTRVKATPRRRYQQHKDFEEYWLVCPDLKSRYAHILCQEWKCADAIKATVIQSDVVRTT